MSETSDILCITEQMFGEVRLLEGHDILLGTHPKNLQKEELCLLFFRSGELQNLQSVETVEDRLEEKMSSVCRQIQEMYQ